MQTVVENGSEVRDMGAFVELAATGRLNFSTRPFQLLIESKLETKSELSFALPANVQYIRLYQGSRMW